MKIGIIDYGVGNIGSVISAFKAVGTELYRISDPDRLNQFDKIILPGVGAFGVAMQNLRTHCLDRAILDFVKTGRAVFGVCLGMQLLFDEGREFGNHKGLGIIPGSVERFSFEPSLSKRLKIPHMGWDTCKILKSSAILSDFSDHAYLYFVHSYHAKMSEENYQRYVIAECEYGYRFPAIVQYENVFGIQPHPEKSDSNGLKILENFVRL